MPFADRFWWLNLIPVVLIAGVGGALIVLLQMTPLESFGYETFQGIFGFTIVLLAVIISLTVVYTVYAVVQTLQARSRWLRRQRTLRGDLSAMFAATPSVDPSRAPDVTSEPLVLSWRATPATVYMVRAITTTHVTLLVIVMVLMLDGVVAARFAPLVTHSTAVRSVAIAATLVVNVALFAGLVKALVRLVALLVPSYFGKPFGVLATGDGIACTPEIGRQRFVRWDEARLLEAVATTSFTTPPERTFVLYGTRSVAKWGDERTYRQSYAPDGMTESEMAERSQALLDLVAARTGLTPRTLSKKLRPATKESAKEFLADQRQHSTFALLVLSLCLGALAGVIIVVPPSAYSVLNELVLLSFVLPAVLGTAISVRALLKRPTVMPTDHVLLNFPQVRVPKEAENEQQVFVMAQRPSSFETTGMVVLGAVLCVDLVPAIVAWVPTLLVYTIPSLLLALGFTDASSQVSDTARALLAPLGLDAVPLLSTPIQILDGVLLLFGGGGALLVLSTRKVDVLHVQADETGLTRSTDINGIGKSVHVPPVSVPWRTITRITALVQRGAIQGYMVHGETTVSKVYWAASGSQQLHIASPGDALPISPHEMAALAAQRSGKPIEFEAVR